MNFSIECTDNVLGGFLHPPSSVLRTAIFDTNEKKSMGYRDHQPVTNLTQGFWAGLWLGLRDLGTALHLVTKASCLVLLLCCIKSQESETNKNYNRVE